jgi:ribonuclease HI
MRTVITTKKRAQRSSARAKPLPDANQLEAVAEAYMGGPEASPIVHALVADKTRGYACQDAKKSRQGRIETEQVLEMLVSAHMRCCYCDCIMRVHYAESRDPQQWTLDRVDNTDGHHRENLVVACLQCNLKRRTIDKEKFAFAQKMQIERVAAPLAIYVDGSCTGNTNVRSKACPAGWGMAVIDDGRVEEYFGPVVLEQSHAAFVGAEAGSNNTAELSAMCEALLYTACSRENGRHVTIHYDSEYAHAVTTGEKRAHANKALVGQAKDALFAAKKGGPIEFEHVKAHSGDMYNDLVDALARRGALGERAGWGSRWG